MIPLLCPSQYDDDDDVELLQRALLPAWLNLVQSGL
uniref:Uncharacterized protein n=1 Tax=Arundo donax TaxID=35708 RepID=A0A0A8YPX5_ARUDO